MSQRGKRAFNLSILKIIKDVEKIIFILTMIYEFKATTQLA